MSDHQFSISFEIYLVIGTAFLMSTFAMPSMTAWIDEWAKRLRPGWTRTTSIIVRIALLVVFAPLTAIHTYELFSN